MNPPPPAPHSAPPWTAPAERSAASIAAMKAGSDPDAIRFFCSQ
eukprot:CAMPEP_0174751798 /NCGR_PEP_ID=MMETSP1094-20130205/100609_1 /TAXON_ID=156173 /ORGANISM="Chrysochromulina brevifilum, Strain UTEX LB 985" /LENGTH=43 /DNA_ID= /DNA_START= /DNA_END= /DNA_ORIENTATION=